MDSQSMPPPFMLGMGGSTSVTPTDSAYFGLLGDAAVVKPVGSVGNAMPFNPHGLEHTGAVAIERSNSANAGTSWDLVRDGVGLTSKGTGVNANPGTAVTTRGPIDLFSRRSGTAFPYHGRLGGFIQGSLTAAECTDLLDRYQTIVEDNIP